MAEEKTLTTLTDKDRNLLKAKSPAVLPDNPSGKGWTAAQIKAKFYESSLLLFEWLQKTQRETKELFELSNEDISTLQEEVKKILSGESVVEKAHCDEEGNNIVASYVKKDRVAESKNETDETKLISLAIAKALINEIINGADARLDTLKELAEALDNDPSFATTIINKISEKLSIDEADKKFATKLDKVTSKSEMTKVYAKDNQGNQIMLNAANEHSPDALWQFDNSGRAIYRKTDLTDYEVTNKKYVDTKISPLSEKIEKQIVEMNDVKAMLYGYLFDALTYTFNYLNTAKIPATIVENGIYYNVQDNARTMVHSIEGNTIIWNQLQQKSSKDTTSSNGITMTNNHDGSYTLSGTATEDTLIRFPERASSLEIGHKYLIKGCPKNGSDKTFFINDGWNSASPRDYGEGAVYEYSIIFRGFLLIMTVKAGTTIDNLVAKPQVFDLTLMFGEGHEPTIDEFNAMFPKSYYDYNVGEIMSSSVSGVTINSNSLSFPATILKGIQNHHDYYQVTKNGNNDFYTLKKVTTIREIDLGELNYEFTYTTSTASVHSDDLSNESIRPLSNGNKVVPPWICSSTNYKIITPEQSELNGDSLVDKAMSLGGNGYSLRINDSSFTTIEDLKASLMGVKLMYVLKTPTEEVISTTLTRDEVTALCKVNDIVEIVGNDNADFVRPNLTLDLVVKKVEEQSNE